MSSYYASNNFQKDVISGTFRGATFGFCWGLIQGSYLQFDEKLSFPKYTRKMAKYTCKSIILFTPLVIVSHTSKNFIKSHNIGDTPSMIAAICITTLCFGFVKKFI